LIFEQFRIFLSSARTVSSRFFEQMNFEQMTLLLQFWERAIDAQ
jgi:hypothetical protein